MGEIKMGLNKSLSLLAMLVVISIIPGCAAGEDTVFFDDTVNDVITSYGLDPVEVQFVNLDNNRIGEVRCSVGTNRCDVYFDYCALDLSPRIQRNLAVHEATHYVNAQINQLYDHGSQWQHLMRAHDEIPIVSYNHIQTRQCD